VQPQPATSAGRGPFHVAVSAGLPVAVRADDAAPAAAHRLRQRLSVAAPATAAAAATPHTQSATAAAAATATATATAATPPPPATVAVATGAVATAVRAGRRRGGCRGRASGHAVARVHRRGRAHVTVAERVRQVQRELPHDFRSGVPHAIAPQGRRRQRRRWRRWRHRWRSWRRVGRGRRRCGRQEATGHGQAPVSGVRRELPGTAPPDAAHDRPSGQRGRPARRRGRRADAATAPSAAPAAPAPRGQMTQGGRGRTEAQCLVLSLRGRPSRIGRLSSPLLAATRTRPPLPATTSQLHFERISSLVVR